MIRYIILISFCFNISFSIGIRALAIPQSATLLGKSGTGISHSIHINPALIVSDNPYVSFSKNKWFGGLEGQKISTLLKNNMLLSFESLKVEDIELRDQIANDTPIGFFGVYWYAWELNRKVNIKKNNLSFGYKLKFNFSKLYTESMHGYTIDLGMLKTINNKLDLGVVIKNLGNESMKSMRAGTIPIVGVGINYRVLDGRLLILYDVISQDSINITKIAFETQFPYINFILGGTLSDNGSNNSSDYYHDIAFGLTLEYKGWAFAYGNLNHSNSILGNPNSITLTKYF